MTSPSLPCLTLNNVHSGYGVIPILHGVSLTLAGNETLGILGHNGMGKTTLMKTLMGFLKITSGTVACYEDDITKMPVHKRSRMGIGYVPQGRLIFPKLSVYENLKIACHLNFEETDEDAIERILEHFPRLRNLLKRQGGNLSGGEQQILALARCFVTDPWLVLLDEPTEGIQPSIREEIGEILQNFQKKHGLSILLVEQNIDFILQVSDRILLLDKGEIAAETSNSEIQDIDFFNEFTGFGKDTKQTPNGQAKKTSSQTRAKSEINSANTNSFGQAKTSEAPAFTNQVAPPKTHVETNHHSLSRELPMSVKRPTFSQMREIVNNLHMSLSDADISEYLEIMEPYIQAYDVVDSMPDYLPQTKYPRTPGYRPSPEENPLNAWYIKCEVRGASNGVLSGKSIVLKDNICLAGVPMMNGASTLEGYTPDIDATIVTRILDAGGTIVGKAHCEYFCLSGGSHTNATGPVHNPYKKGYSAGGSSSGSGALVGSGEVEMAIGGDQGGSIRIPAAFSGCYGMKPTHGLVPYTGVMPIEITIDHVGPMTRTVADNALFLEVIAGDDGLDPRQYAPRTDQYTASLLRGVHGMKIAVVKEGFGHENSEPDVDAKVKETAEKFKTLGAFVEEVSLPMHSVGSAIWTPIALEGLTDLMMHGNGMGTNWKGLFTTSLLDAHSNWRHRANELSNSLKISMFMGEYFLKNYRGHYYAKAQNLSRKLRAAYDQCLSQYDLLLMPTLPMKATPLPPADGSLNLYIQRAFEMITNTAPFNVTGHPAMNIPCGMSQGLPIGAMLVGKHYAESTIYRAAAAFEGIGDWRNM